MPKKRVYVDTSVFGGTQDEEFATFSQRFFARVHHSQFIVMISQITLDELSGAPEAVQDVLRGIAPENLVLVAANDEAADLAQAYLNAGVVGGASLADALHVATASVLRADVILSWNFRHIVNYDRIHKYNGVNALKGYPSIEIYSPMEMSDANEDEDV